MNIFINTLSDSIILCRPLTKKGVPFFREYSFPYSLKRFDNKVKAVNELLTDEVKKLFENDQINSLVLSDDVVFHGLMSVPTFSFNKSIDAFKTKIKINFPNIKDYFIKYSQEEKNSQNTKIVYSLVQTKQSKGLVDAFEHHNIKIKNISFFSEIFNNFGENKSEYPNVTLIIGKEMSEVIVTKGKSVLGTSVIGLGTEALLNPNELYLSTYNLNNSSSLKYASFHKTNFDSKDLLTDELILKNPIHESFEIPKPKEARILKGETLENYTKKQNFLRFHTRVLDILDAYKEDPYFIPISEIKVHTTDEIFELLKASNSVENIKYVKVDEDFKKLYESHISHNPLFDSQLITKERKKIEWSKLLTMEIGKKKKA